MLVTGPGRWELSEAPVFQLFAPPVEARMNASKYKKIAQTLFRMLVSSQVEYLLNKISAKGYLYICHILPSVHVLIL